MFQNRLTMRGMKRMLVNSSCFFLCFIVSIMFHYYFFDFIVMRLFGIISIELLVSRLCFTFLFFFVAKLIYHGKSYISSLENHLIKLYCLILIAVLFFRFDRFGEGVRAVNVVPFSTISMYLLYPSHFNTNIIIANVLGNIILFIPLGFILKKKWPKNKMLIMLGCFFIPLIVEIVQLLFRVGSFDIDDVILNGLGIFLGSICFELYSKLTNKIVKISI